MALLQVLVAILLWGIILFNLLACPEVLLVEEGVEVVVLMPLAWCLPAAAEEAIQVARVEAISEVVTRGGALERVAGANILPVYRIQAQSLHGVPSVQLQWLR
jgi:hypothetical protein